MYNQATINYRIFKNYKITLLILMAFIFGFTNPNISDAAEKKDKAAKRAQLMMQKMKQDMEAEKAAMQAQFDTQKKELEEKLKVKEEEVTVLDKKLTTAERKVSNLTAENKKLSVEKTTLENKLQVTESTLDSTQKTLTETKNTLQQAQADLKFNDNQRKTLSTNLAQTTKSVNECEEKNSKLHQFGTELILIYDNPTSYEAAMRKEKFFQLKRVELENILQSKQDNLDEARFVNKK
jgi:chromosome segregation ATPase